jgi:3-oxoacyl-(acyl-carrier-protein) synthase
MRRFWENRALRDRLSELESLRARFSNSDTAELDRRIHELKRDIEAHGYSFDRRFIFKVLSMGHSQFAEYIGARGPNTHINAACASGTQTLSLASDWIREGRCRRVICITADDVTHPETVEWIGAGFLATGAAATDANVEDAALPFDRRRHGMLLGMGASGMVVEAADSVAERGIRPIGEVLGTTTLNSAFHGTRLDVDHISAEMEKLLTSVERRYGVDRKRMAKETVFVSHETYTPARGGSAAAEVQALRRVFGDAADDIVVANTKGMTGHAMGAGIEDVVATKILETGLVPPVANYREVDPELGTLNLSKGGSYPVRYALRFGAGFGSQLAMSLVRWSAPPDGQRTSPYALGFKSRLEDEARFKSWLQDVSGVPDAELETHKRTLRVKDDGARGGKSADGAAARRVQPRPAAQPAPRPAPKPELMVRSSMPTPRPRCRRRRSRRPRPPRHPPPHRAPTPSWPR